MATGGKVHIRCASGPLGRHPTLRQATKNERVGRRGGDLSLEPAPRGRPPDDPLFASGTGLCVFFFFFFSVVLFIFIFTFQGPTVLAVAGTCLPTSDKPCDRHTSLARSLARAQDFHFRLPPPSIHSSIHPSTPLGHPSPRLADFDGDGLFASSRQFVDQQAQTHVHKRQTACQQRRHLVRLGPCGLPRRRRRRRRQVGEGADQGPRVPF
ncbi:hypothetical protein F4780DRAFT_731980 [Xylariomycetidae sp. FL0641]|nr:hypothetical protein F4780DRAFT_731980 [Xylariomycetidae sp. FL0641]